MSSTTQTRGQMVARYDRLKKRVDIFKPVDKVAKSLMDVAKTTMEMFPVTASAQASSISLPSWGEVESFMRNLTPFPSEIFTAQFFGNPLYPAVTLHDIVEFYGCPAIDSLVADSLGLSEEDKENRTISIHVWFADFLCCDKDTILEVIRIYKSHRGSPDMIRRLAVSVSSKDGAEGKKKNASPSSDAAVNREKFGTPQRTNNHAANVPVIQGRHDLQSSGTPTPSAGNPVDDDSRIARNQQDVLAVQDVNDSRKATNVFQHFKDNKFTGDISQSIELVIREYNVCYRQHNLSYRQKADFFVNELADPARTFFFNNARDNMTFNEMADMMVREYNSDARQLQVQSILETLRLDKYMAEHDLTSHSETLTKLVELIERLTHQCQPQFRSDANKINYLRKAVLGCNWAMVPIGNIITAKYTFNEFVTALREHLQLENEVTQTNPVVPRSRRNALESTFHQQYGRNPKHVRKYGTSGHQLKLKNQSRSSGFEESRRKGICHICKLKWRPEHRCNPGSVRGYVRDRFKKGDSAVHIVSDLVLGLEGDANAADDDAVSSAEEDDHNCEEVHFEEANDDLSVFDQLTSDGAPNATAFVEAVDQEWFTNHLSAAFSESEAPQPDTPPQDF